MIGDVLNEDLSVWFSEQIKTLIRVECSIIERESIMKGVKNIMSTIDMSNISESLNSREFCIYGL